MFCFAMCLPWIVPLLWAILVANVRMAKDRNKIVLLAAGGVLAFFATPLWLFRTSHSDWPAWIVATIMAIEYLGMSWGAVVWAHRSRSQFYKPPQGFPIEPFDPSWQTKANETDWPFDSDEPPGTGKPFDSDEPVDSGM